MKDNIMKDNIMENNELEKASAQEPNVQAHRRGGQSQGIEIQGKTSRPPCSVQRLVLPTGDSDRADSKKSSIPSSNDCGCYLLPQSVRKRGTSENIMVMRNPDNPDHVVEIVSMIFGTGEEYPMPARQRPADSGQIINGEFVSFEQIASDKMLESVGINRSENMEVGRHVETNIPMVHKHISGGNHNPQIA